VWCLLTHQPCSHRWEKLTVKHVGCVVSAAVLACPDQLGSPMSCALLPNTHKLPTAAAAGIPPEVVPAAAAMKASLVTALAGLALPPNALDQLLDELGGPGAVAEMTGRKGRAVRDGAGRAVYEVRGRAETAGDLDSLNGGWGQGGLLPGKACIRQVPRTEPRQLTGCQEHGRRRQPCLQQHFAPCKRMRPAYLLAPVCTHSHVKH
jgi:hypothetical protein